MRTIALTGRSALVLDVCADEDHRAGPYGAVLAPDTDLEVGWNGGTATIEVQGTEAEPVRLWRFHKPKGLVTTHQDPQGRPTVFEKLPPEMPRDDAWA